MIPADRIYADLGDRLSGRRDPPRRCGPDEACHVDVLLDLVNSG